MGKWRRRLRGAVGIGLIWAAAWFGAGMLLLLVVGPDAADVPFPLFFGLLGFLAGTTFSAILGAVAARRTFSELSQPRVVGWGALGGLVLAGSFVLTAGLSSAFAVLAPVFALAGGLSAAGTLAIARRAGATPRIEASAPDSVRPSTRENELAAPTTTGKSPRL